MSVPTIRCCYISDKVQERSSRADLCVCQLWPLNEQASRKEYYGLHTPKSPPMVYQTLRCFPICRMTTTLKLSPPSTSRVDEPSQSVCAWLTIPLTRFSRDRSDTRKNGAEQDGPNKDRPTPMRAVSLWCNVALCDGEVVSEKQRNLQFSLPILTTFSRLTAIHGTLLLSVVGHTLLGLVVSAATGGRTLSQVILTQ